MIQANIREVRQHISHLLDEVLRGEVVTIQRRGESVAQIVPVEGHPRRPLPSLKVFRRSVSVKGSLTKTLLSEREVSR